MRKIASSIYSMDKESFFKSMKDLKEKGFEVEKRPDYVDEYGKISYSATIYENTIKRS